MNTKRWCKAEVSQQGKYIVHDLNDVHGTELEKRHTM